MKKIVFAFFLISLSLSCTKRNANDIDPLLSGSNYRLKAIIYKSSSYTFIYNNWGIEAINILYKGKPIDVKFTRFTDGKLVKVQLVESGKLTEEYSYEVDTQNRITRAKGILQNFLCTNTYDASGNLIEARWYPNSNIDRYSAETFRYPNQNQISYQYGPFQPGIERTYYEYMSTNIINPLSILNKLNSFIFPLAVSESYDDLFSESPFILSKYCVTEVKFDGKTESKREYQLNDKGLPVKVSVFFVDPNGALKQDFTETILMDYYPQ